MQKEALIIIISFLIGYYIDWTWARIVRGFHLQKENYYKVIIKGIRIHHNFLGYIFIIFGFFYYPLFFTSAGIGNIFGHKIRDNFAWFIEDLRKESKQIKKEAKELQKKVKSDVKKQVGKYQRI